MSDTERSFGSVIYRKKHKKIEYLAVKSQTKKSIGDFPKDMPVKAKQVSRLLSERFLKRQA